MKKILKRVLNTSNTGKKVLDYLRHRKNVFIPASREPFEFLNKLFKKRHIDKVYEEAFDQIFVLLKSLPLKGNIFEFGVFQGYTSILLAKYIRKFSFKDTSLHLFDSFEGLPKPEDLDKKSYEFVSGDWVKGSMSVPDRTEELIQKKLLKILAKDKIKIIKGFFENTLENYLKQKSYKARLIHLDCDTYSSSKLVLNMLFKYEVIQDGTLIIFDDWMTSLGNPNLGQRKATNEVLTIYPKWSLEKYFNYGIGSHVFVVHDLRI